MSDVTFIYHVLFTHSTHILLGGYLLEHSFSNYAFSLSLLNYFKYFTSHTFNLIRKFRQKLSEAPSFPNTKKFFKFLMKTLKVNKYYLVVLG